MFRVTSLTEMPEAQLNRLIKRVGLLFFVALVAFAAFYAIDRLRFSPAPIVDQELAKLEELVRADPADAIARGQLADLYYAKGRYREAVGQYTMLIDAGKSVQLASLGRAKSQQKLEAWDASIPDFQKVVEIGLTSEMAARDPILAAGYYGLGTTYLGKDQPKEAIEPLRKALAIQSTDADVLYGLGTAYVEAGQAKEAIEPLNLAVALVPNNWPEPYALLQRVYTELADADHAAWAAAMTAFATGDAVAAEAQLTPLAEGDAALEASIGLGVINETTGDTGAAAGWYAKALELDPENISAQLGLGRTSMPAASPSQGSK